MTGAHRGPRWFARQVVLRRAAVIAIATGLTHLLAVRGILPAGAGEAAVEWTGRAVDALGVLVGVAAIRAGVTPADPALAPRALDGRRLTPAGPTPTVVDPADSAPPPG